MSEIISFKKKHYNAEEWLEGITQFNHKHHHLVDVNGDQKEKAEIFNKGEDLKLQISKKQFNILTGEDKETKCFLECPYRALFKASVGAMGRERRQEFKNLWEDPLVDEMVEEVERELEEYELESDDEEQTVEPEGCDSHTSSSEEEEDDASPEARERCVDSPEARVLRDKEDDYKECVSLRGAVAAAYDASNFSDSRGRNPFHGSPIVTPGGEVDCSETCSKNDLCDAWPLRMCAQDSHCDTFVCLHKQLFPMLPLDVTFFFVIFIVSFLAGAPGIGGGGINVPLLMMLNRFTIKEAVPISHIAVQSSYLVTTLSRKHYYHCYDIFLVGNALSQLLFNTRLRHPSMPLRPLIHYEMAAILLPAMLGGNSLGIVVSKIFPPTALVLLSLILLIFAAAKTMHKGLVAFRHSKLEMKTSISSWTKRKSCWVVQMLTDGPMASHLITNGQMKLSVERAIFLNLQPGRTFVAYKVFPSLGCDDLMNGKFFVDLGCDSSFGQILMTTDRAGDPYCIDLCSGMGGWSIGARHAGIRFAVHIEKDRDVAEAGSKVTFTQLVTKEWIRDCSYRTWDNMLQTGVTIIMPFQDDTCWEKLAASGVDLVAASLPCPP
eukprot:symbB.v1.2.017430.t1/scaffold1360.1/size203234/1